MSVELQIRLFGGLQLTQGDSPLSQFISNKVPALLAYLAVNPRPHPRDSLAALFWGEMPDADARNNLRQGLSNLRKFVAPHLLITRETVAFDTTQPHFLDVAQFAAQIAEDSSLTPEQQIERLEQAIQIYQGDFLEGILLKDAPAFDDWVTVQRAHWRELALHALTILTDWYIHQRNYTQAITSATRLLGIDSWREEAHRQLMVALARSGQPAAALQQYDACCRLLADELGVEPSAETRRVAERIRAMGATPRHNLPLAPTSFVGRTSELNQITASFQQSNCRLLTLVGAGGAGKTRLAQEAARLLVDDFADGVWFVSLASLSQADDLSMTIANTLGVTFSGAAAPQAQLLDYLRHKELLLILDNFEHLLENLSLDLMSALLTQASELRLLVTSRERLNLQAETILTIDGLPYPAAATEATNQPPLSEFPAVQLFIERARRLQTDFASEQQEAMIVHLCQLVDGLPLALELAVTWIRTLSVAEIVTEIERGTDFLATNLRDIPARHRSLRAVFDYSWHLLSPQEQEAYRRLAIFRGGFTLAAAQAVTGLQLPLLAGLVDKSLLRRDQDQRYRRHPLLIQFAADKLAEDPALLETVRVSHAHYFGRFIQSLEPVFLGGQADAALAQVRPEMENLRLAWQVAVEQKDVGLINQMADSFMQIFDMLGRYGEGVELANRLIKALDEHINLNHKEEALALGRAYGLSGAFHFRLGEYGLAAQHSQISGQIVAPFQPHIAYGHAFIYAGAAAFGLGDFPQVISHWQAAARAYQQAGSIWGETVAQGNLSEVLLALGDIPAAQEYAQASLALAQQIESPELIANALVVLSAAAHQEKQYEQADRLGQQALQYHRQIDHTAHIANDLAVLANIANDQAQYEKALGYLREGVRMLRRVGNRLYLVQRLVELGQVALNAGQLAEAETTLQEALVDAIASNTVNIALRALNLLAELRRQQGHLVVALRVAQFVAQHEGATADTHAAAAAFVQTLSTQVEADPRVNRPPSGQTLDKQMVQRLLAIEARPTWLAPAESNKKVVPPSSPQLAGRFVMETFMARGGMGEVYRGRDTQTGQLVAIKRLLPHLIAPDSEMVARFRREAEVLRQLDHPNIVKMIEAREENDQLMIVMEYVPGGSLRDLLDQTPQLPLAQVRFIALELADALARTHHQHIIHRDLKPANVLLAADGTPRLTDFGIARLGEHQGHLTTQGTTLGTVAYMSPEACRGEPLDARTDIWSFGVMLYEMLCGRNPFEKVTVTATLTAILHDPLPEVTQDRPNLPAPLADLLHQLLIRDRNQRLSSMRVIAAALENLLIAFP